ncbi:MAG: glycosyltransferase [Puniceicoccaceae bacterium 5H]|nr:MAG: glycosyltransferase [Puniceicoccaceae bacterium 5H]
MKVLFTFAISDFTGASRMGFRYVRALREAGHEVICVAQPPPATGDSIVHRLREDGFEVHHFGNFLTTANPLLVWRIAAFIRRRGIDVVSSMNQGDVKTSGWAAWLAGVPYEPQVQNLRNFGPGRAGRIKGALYGLTMRCCSQLAVASSPATEAETLRRFGVRPGAVVCVHNAIDPSALPAPDAQRREQLRGELGLEPQHFVFSCVGRLGEQKGQKYLLPAWADLVRRFPHARLLMIGGAGVGVPEEEAYAAELKQMVDDLDVRDSVQLLGWRDDVSSLLQASDGYVHSALWEGFPLAVLEALGSRLPTVMTDCVGRPRGFVDDLHGYVVPTGESAPLARGMAALLEKTPEQRAQMGAACRALLEAEFDIRRNEKLLVRVMEAAARG